MTAEHLPPKDLRDACVDAAHRFIMEHGVERLSLRDVARKLNVSHQAPYRHFASRDHLLAEVIRRCFYRFTQVLVDRDRSDEPLLDMASLGQAYLKFALEHPLEYRLMFGTPWPTVDVHPELIRDARNAFGVLRTALQPLFSPPRFNEGQLDLEALFVWSSMHGLATILQSQVMDHLELGSGVVDAGVAHILTRVESALVAAAAPMNDSAMIWQSG